MFFSQRELDVDSGEQSENVRLKNGHQNLKEREDEAESERAHAEQFEESSSVEEEPGCCTKAQHQEQVAGDHVHEKSQCQRDRTKNEDREELDGRHDDVDRPGNTGREERVLEEGAGVLAQTGVNEGHVRDNRHDDGHTHERGSGNVQSGDDARDVEGQCGEEDGGQQRQKTLAVFLTQEVFSDVHAHDVEGHLSEQLTATGNELHAAGTKPEKQNQNGRHEQTNHDDSVDLKRGAYEKKSRREKLKNRRADKATVAA